jgi:F-type H+-transporting ATPase subunit epsilon
MNLKVLLPFRIFEQVSDVLSIVADSIQGSFGILPHRLDCAAALVPGILAYKTASADTIYVAVDQGILVKTGADVLVSVRRAVGGADLTALHQMVMRQFAVVDSEERDLRAAVSKMEGSLVGRLATFSRGES